MVKGNNVNGGASSRRKKTIAALDAIKAVGKRLADTRSDPVSGRAKAPRRGATPRQRQSVFGPVSTIDTAPVSIGNTISGAKPVVVPIEDGVRVKGRDMLSTLVVTGTAVTGWTLVAGAPITPMCMVSSAIKGYANSYAEYCIHGVAFHYITSATTGNAGSVAMFINKSRAGPGLPTDNSTFLPTVLSDHNTVLTPIWKNGTAVYHPPPRWYVTSVMNDEGLHEQCPGELLVYDRVGEAVAPGYVLVDYDISFRNMQASSKQLSLPVQRMKYHEIALYTNASVVANQAAEFHPAFAVLLDNTTVSSLPPGWAIGDVYKFILNLNDSVFGGSNTASNLIFELINAGQYSRDVVLTDGFTCFMYVNAADKVYLCANLDLALTGNSYSWKSTQSTNANLRGFVSLVGTISGTLLQANI